MKVYTSIKPAEPGVTIFVFNAEAEYHFDAGHLKEAGPSQIFEHVLHIWEELDPIPVDANELTFIITEFGDIKGPWEFKIPLE